MDRSIIALQAETWIGTKFHHQGRVKKTKRNNGAVDCIGLIVGISDELNLKSHITDKQGRKKSFIDVDQKTYSREPQGQKLKEALDLFLDPIDISEAGPGDVLLFTLARFPQHVAVIADHGGEGLAIIHAYQPVKFVCKHHLCDKWKRRICAAYRFRNTAFEG